MSEPAQHHEIAIVGAGFSGLGMAIELRSAGIEDFVVLERADDLGGTWRDNSYPGCACDIPSVLYSWTKEQNPRWGSAFAGQAEIWDYMRDIVSRHDLGRHLRYRHEVLELRWLSDLAQWEIDTAQGTLTADVVVSAAGALADPSIPALPRLESFRGTTFHSAHWNHDHDLRGRRVAVIGTGASAIQFVPEIQPEVGRLTVFQRTPPWVTTRSNPDIPARWRRRFERHPRLLAAARRVVFGLQESLHVGFKHPRLMKVLERSARRHLERQVPDPGLRAKLTPDYRLGCKRILGSDTWYPALCAENVEVVTAGIGSITPDGIRDADGIEHPVDTIIFGTGFQVTDPPISHRVQGPHGRTLAEAWQGSPRAHLGIAPAGFPNLFFLLGPNTGLGHNSVLLMIEAQVDYLMRLLEWRRQTGLSAVEARPEVEARFVQEVDRGTKGSVWTAGGCLSWYLDATGRNSTLWPGSVRAYQRRLSHFEESDYRVWRPRPGSTPLPDRVPDAVPALA
jgi:cation diffusion facilitator CzcD-associated flavoprotein CzcO